MENTNYRADAAMRRLLFPEGHPNHSATLETMIADVEKVTVADLKAFHEKYYGPESMVMVAVGDLEDAAVRKAVETAFKGWKGGVAHPEYDRASRPESGREEIVFMPEKTSATVRFAVPTTLTKSDPDYLPLYLGNFILGGNFSARLMSIVRDDEGLTYGIYSGHEDDIFSDGQWYIQGTFSPDLVNKGLASTRREIARWVKDGVSAEELKNKKTTLVGSFKVQLATTGGMANQIRSFIERGYGPDYIDQYPKDIEALSLEQVNGAIRKYVDPKQVAVVIAGTVEKSDLSAME